MHKIKPKQIVNIESDKAIETKGMKGFEVYTYENLPKFEEFLSTATSDVSILSVSFAIATHQVDTIRRLIKSNKDVTILVVNRENNDFLKRLESYMGWSVIDSGTRSSLKTLCEMRREGTLINEERNHLTIFTYDAHIPIFNMVILDRRSENPTIQFGAYFLGNDVSQRICVITTKKQNPKFCNKCLEDYQAILKKAKKFDYSKV